jgi:ribose 5-phosphate isomerase B
MTKAERKGSTMKLPLKLGYDEFGNTLAKTVTDALAEGGHEVSLVAGSGKMDYPEIAAEACAKFNANRFHSIILICDSGIGMCIAANKFPDIRAVRCTDSYTVEKARRHANANVMTIGSGAIAAAHASTLIQDWVRFDFDSLRSLPKIQRIREIERSLSNFKRY